MVKNNVHVISFGAPFNEYKNARQRLTHLQHFNEVKSITAISEKDIFQFCPEISQHKNFLFSNRRGFGYWLWKMFLVKELMNHIPEGEMTFYIDMGCAYNVNENAKKRFSDYVNYAYEHDALFLHNQYKEKSWTKMDTYVRIFPNDKSHLETFQITGGFQFLKNTPQNKNIINEIIELMIENNYHNITDAPSIIKNDNTFVEHRHDQSVKSLIVKKYNLFFIKGEINWQENWENGRNYPILALRFKN